MDSTDSSRLERYDLEPVPEPSVVAILEGVAIAMQAACELAEPMRTSARVLTLSTRIKAAADGHMTPDELLASLRRLTQEWS